MQQTTTEAIRTRKDNNTERKVPQRGEQIYMATFTLLIFAYTGHEQEPRNPAFSLVWDCC